MSIPVLNKIPLSDALNKNGIIMTMDTGQWDAVLQVAYDGGCILIEINAAGKPVAAYQRRVEA